MSAPPEGSPAPTEELREELERVLEPRLAPGDRIASVVRRPSLFRTSFPIEELEVASSGGQTWAIVFKDLDRTTLTDEARKAKPEFLFDPRREIETYRDMLSGAPPATPLYYGSTLEPGRGRYWLFVENVRGAALWQIGDFAVWREAARWLAALHADPPDQSGGAGVAGDGSLLLYNAAFYRRWMERALDFAAARSRRDPVRARLEWLAARYEGVVERLASLPGTFIHGEFYASNVIVREPPAGGPICPIDWELAAIGPGLVDVAALTSGKLAEAEKAAIATAYWSAIAAQGAAGPEDAGERDAALDCARLHLAVQWLGWAPDWRPPRKQRQDWLAEALRLAERLRL